MLTVHGWIPDRKDPRDRLLFPTPASRMARAARAPFLPPALDLVEMTPQLWPEVYDQSTLGSCVFNGWSAAIAYAEAREGHGPRVVSRLAPYWHYRQRIGKVDEDTGATIRDGIKTIARVGVPLESWWPYDLAQWKTKPSLGADAEGRHRRVGIEYARMRNLGEIVACIAGAYPVVFGTTLFDSFGRVDARNPVVPMPTALDSEAGGHCMVFVGYDLRAARFRVRNSWGKGWALAGHCYMPFEYVEACASDFWTVRRIAA